MSNRAPTALPPLPPAEGRLVQVQGLSFRVEAVPGMYPAEQVEAIRRETVQACAEAANQSLTSGRSLVSLARSTWFQ